MIDAIIDALSRAAQWIVKLIIVVINRVIDFARDVRDWFRQLGLKKGRHNPFIAKAKDFKEQLQNAPVVDAGIFDNDNAVFEGVYDNYTDAIVEARVIKSDEGLDDTTRNILNRDKLVVLT